MPLLSLSLSLSLSPPPPPPLPRILAYLAIATVLIGSL